MNEKEIFDWLHAEHKASDTLCLNELEDENGWEWENVQLIDIIKAGTLEEALAEAKATLREGDYEGFEYLHLRELGEAHEFGEGVEE